MYMFNAHINIAITTHITCCDDMTIGLLHVHICTCTRTYMYMYVRVKSIIIQSPIVILQLT